MNDFFFFFAGLATGSIGTLIGAGGGFLLAPLFLFLFPEMSPARLAGLSLLAVAANSISGSIGYAFRRQVHWRSVFLFSLFAIPGVTTGVKLGALLPRSTFESIFAGFLLGLSIFVFTRSTKPASEEQCEHVFWNRRAKILGSLVSIFVGLLSSLLGIGGGIVHVPLLSEVLLYPVHIAAGTSHAILAITSSLAVAEHFMRGDYSHIGSFVPYLVMGLLIGAQIGAAFSKKIASRWILKYLAMALLLVSLRLLIRNFLPS